MPKPDVPRGEHCPVRTFGAKGDTAPVVFDSPHSGRTYPSDFRPQIPVEGLFGYEDRLVDTLVADAPARGITLVAAQFPRAYIDPNRAEDDLELEITGPQWPGATNPLYAAKGIGLIFRTSLAGTPIYERALGHTEINDRIARFWRPYHHALETALRDAQRQWGSVWHASWHSMRPVGDALSSDPGELRPDFVLSDRDGTSTEPGFMELVDTELRRLGYSTARNWPFKGGYITALHGRPSEGRHSLQVEINRALYLDPETLEVTGNAGRLRQDLAGVAAAIALYARARAPLTTF